MDYIQIINKYPESCQWKVLLRNNRLIDSIKELRKAENLLLKEAKDVVEFYRDTLRAELLRCIAEQSMHVAVNSR